MDVPPALTEPALAQHASFLSALREYQQEGLHTDLDVEHLADEASFSRWIEEVRADGLCGRAAVERDRVPHRVLWWTRGEEYLGRVRINLALNDELRAFGGHIGYDVRPSARGRGHARAIAAAALEIAAQHGIDEVLLTCAEDNHASRRVIERNGGEFLDVSPAGRLRFVCARGRPAPARPAG